MDIILKRFNNVLEVLKKTFVKNYYKKVLKKMK